MTKRQTRVGLFFSVMGMGLMLAGCGGSMRAATANEIGCGASDTDIFDPEEQDGHEVWIAKCRGHRPEYRCARPQDSERVTCTTVTEGSESTED